MQKDMHYDGVYCLARAAGLNEEAAGVIAWSSQYVDNCPADSVEFEDAGAVYGVATAHHPIHYNNTIFGKENQRQVWVPFHFLPGNEGGGFTERLKCRMNSPIAQEMRDETLEAAARAHDDEDDYSIHRVGVAAHVYADTFSHYGFSGVSSRGNYIVHQSIDLRPARQETKSGLWGVIDSFMERADVFVENIKATSAEMFSGALGHGAAATCPDMPYLVWSFEYEHPERYASGERNNTQTFLEACRELHAMFSRLGELREDVQDSAPVSFENFDGAIRDIFANEGDEQERAKQWQEAARSGILTGYGFEIPRYQEDLWAEDLTSFRRTADSRAILSSNAYRFYRAASDHRQYVLRTLLPRHGLVVA